MPRLITLAIIAAGAGALASCSSMGGTRTRPSIAAATILDADGGVRGNATISRTGDVLVLDVNLNGVSPGVHGVHLHTAGRCAPRDFSSAGGHLNPRSREHGRDNPRGSHLGDLPNINADASGAGSLRFELDGDHELVLSELFDADGTALVVHAGPDDYLTDPSGNSGGRIACGVLVRTH